MIVTWFPYQLQAESHIDKLLFAPYITSSHKLCSQHICEVCHRIASLSNLQPEIWHVQPFLCCSSTFWSYREWHREPIAFGNAAQAAKQRWRGDEHKQSICRLIEKWWPEKPVTRLRLVPLPFHLTMDLLKYAETTLLFRLRTESRGSRWLICDATMLRNRSR